MFVYIFSIFPKAAPILGSILLLSSNVYHRIYLLIAFNSGTEHPRTGQYWPIRASTATIPGRNTGHTIGIRKEFKTKNGRIIDEFLKEHASW
jgi:hypothetical protein